MQILSGVFQGKTTGTPISMIIFNEDTKSRDYESIKDKFRPVNITKMFMANFIKTDYSAIKCHTFHNRIVLIFSSLII